MELLHTLNLLLLTFFGTTNSFNFTLRPILKRIYFLDRPYTFTI